MKFIFFALFSFVSIHLFAGTYDTDKTSQAKEWLKNQPLAFIENKGQITNSEGKSADNVLFKASYGDCDIYITTEGLSYVFLKYEKAKGQCIDTNDIRNRHTEKGVENKTVSYYRLDMNLKGAAISKTQIVKELAGKQGVTNYFFPNCPDGIYGVQEYGKITIKNIYKGIDWVIYTNADNKKSPLKYDFVVHPQADYRDIKIKFVNAQSTQLTDNGTKLKIQTIAGNIEEGNLYSYQENRAEKKAIKTNYIENADSTLEFEIGDYDKTKTLVIDPLVWATYYGGSGNDQFYSICTDKNDNIYITGTTGSSVIPTQQLNGTAYWEPTNKGSYDALILKFNSQGVRQWATYYGGSFRDDPRSIYVDNLDNIFVTGTTDSYNFPTQQLIGAYNQSANEGLDDMFILRFDSQGTRQWASYYGGSNVDWGSTISEDSQHNIYITGITFSTDFPNLELAGAYNQSTMSSNGCDVYILKFNINGVRQWATYYGGNGADFIEDLYIDTHDNIYLTGETSSTNFPLLQLPGAYWQETNAGNDDIFIIKLNNIGERQWATYYGGSSLDDGTSLCTDSQDNIYITGSTLSTDLPTQQLTGAYNQLSSGGNFDMFVLKFNSAGLCKWATYYGGSSDETGTTIYPDKDNNIYLTGATTSTNFPTQQLTDEYWQADNNGGDAVILKFNALGINKWSTYYGGVSFNAGIDIAIDNQNSIYFVGRFQFGAYTQDYGNGSYYDDSGNGNYDGFIIKLSDCNNQKPTSVKTDRNNLCIHDNGTITLTAIGGVGDTLKWYTGGCGVKYIGKGTSLTIPCPIKNTTYYALWESTCDTSACDSVLVTTYKEIMIFQNPILCEGETYTVGPSVYTKTGVYTDYFKTITGCDSIVRTNLVINPVKLSVQNKSICQGQTFTIGTNTYSESGTFTEKLKTYLKCDSTIITNLSVIPSKQTSLSKSICQGESFIVGTNTHTTTGVYIDILTSTSGCDSIVTTNLLVNPTKQTPNNPIICEGESVKVGVNIYTISGTYVDKLSTTFGCDSIVTTNLTVGTKRQNSITRSICTGESFAVGTHTYTKTGTYTDILQTMYSCDSVVTTNLTVDPKIENHLIRSICKGENFPVGTHIYTTSGIYIDNLKARSGCDSIVTTDLTVNPLPLVSLGDNKTICRGDTIVLSPGRSFNSYFWSDGSLLSDLIVTNPGTYRVTVYNDWCPASDEISIYECSAELWFPNAFSPNYDGINDRFKPVIKGTLRSFQLIVFNKWGQQIFESTDASTGWDGTFAGSPSPSGLYTYIANYAISSEPTESKQKVKRGTVTLLK